MCDSLDAAVDDYSIDDVSIDSADMDMNMDVDSFSESVDVGELMDDAADISGDSEYYDLDTESDVTD